ncbi:MAG: hypothetical protein P8182_20335, partial [Deltaproteobacteria bacterium]
RGSASLFRGIPPERTARAPRFSLETRDRINGSFIVHYYANVNMFSFHSLELSPHRIGEEEHELVLGL